MVAVVSIVSGCGLSIQFEWIYADNSLVSIDKWPVLEGNAFVRLFFRHRKPNIPCQSLLLSTVVLND